MSKQASIDEVNDTYLHRASERVEAARDRLDRRADTIVTTTGGLATVIGVVGAVVPVEADTELPALVIALMVGALVCFVLSVVFAHSPWLSPIKYREMMYGTDAALAAEQRQDPYELRSVYATADANYLRQLGHLNERRARSLFLAAGSQMLAIVLLTAAVAVFLLIR